MHIYPAIDLYGGSAVRLVRGDYAQMTTYSTDPAAVAEGFAQAGAERLHLVDLEGAKSGGTPNFDAIRAILARASLPAEVGGGVRSEAVIESYLAAGVWRVILGTAALTEPAFLRRAAARYGERIAVGVDVRDGFVATHGWTALSATPCMEFFQTLMDAGVKAVICTDISRDGLLGGANLALYQTLASRFPNLDIIASGGVTSIADVRALAALGLEGAIIGKALYTGDIDLRAAIAAGKEGA